jgi:hypothetical protein
MFVNHYAKGFSAMLTKLMCAVMFMFFAVSCGKKKSDTVSTWSSSLPSKISSNAK